MSIGCHPLAHLTPCLLATDRGEVRREGLQVFCAFPGQVRLYKLQWLQESAGKSTTTSASSSWIEAGAGRSPGFCEPTVTGGCLLMHCNAKEPASVLSPSRLLRQCPVLSGPAHRNRSDWRAFTIIRSQRHLSLGPPRHIGPGVAKDMS
jgi:hypothetical protein